jgi:hypothetical protein
MKHFQVSYTREGIGRRKQFCRDDELKAHAFAQQMADETRLPAFVYTMELRAISKIDPAAAKNAGGATP